jgi:hypothetical protein
MSMQQRRRAYAPPLAAAPPLPEPKTLPVAPEVTALGLPVTESYMIKIARATDLMRQYEVTDAEGVVRFDGIGDDRFEAITRVAFWLLLGEDSVRPPNN